MLQKFIDYLEEQYNSGAIYVWGAQGQTASEAFIKKYEDGNNETRALKLYRERIKKGFVASRIKAFDCSGLGVCFLLKHAIIGSDMTANGMMGKCTLIPKSELKKGCWVFRRYTTGTKRAYHIGYVVDDDLNVIEAQGRDYGVVKRPLNKGGWNAYGIPQYFEAEITGKNSFTNFTRNLKKGCKGVDVAELQRLLNAAGDNLTVDGEFGSKTKSAVIAYQKLKRLDPDGVAGKDTITALGGIWMGNTTPFTRNLKRGCKGADVKELQRLLNKNGATLAVDGDFGEKTFTAVEKYQLSKNLNPDGVAGKKTISALGGYWGGTA